MALQTNSLRLILALISGCSSLQPQNADTAEAFLLGDTRLECDSFTCAGTDGSNRAKMRALHDAAQWKNLALLAMSVGYNRDLNYYYLGRAAEGLNKLSAAEVYYGLAENAKPCAGIVNNCDGFKFPQIIQYRLSRIAAAKAAPKTEPKPVSIDAIPVVEQSVSQSSAPPAKPSDTVIPTSIDSNANASTKKVIPLNKIGGVYEVAVTLNNVLTIGFIVDSGASDVSISPDVALTLIKTKTIGDKDWLPGVYYRFADGSTAKSARFKLRAVKIGERELRNVTCSISNSVAAPMLLGQSALEKLGRYSIDYEKMVIQLY